MGEWKSKSMKVIEKVTSWESKLLSKRLIAQLRMNEVEYQQTVAENKKAENETIISFVSR